MKTRQLATILILMASVAAAGTVATPVSPQREAVRLADLVWAAYSHVRNADTIAALRALEPAIFAPVSDATVAACNTLDAYVRAVETRTGHADAYALNAANLRLAQAATAGDVTRLEASLIRDQGGRDAQLTRNAAAAQAANAYWANSWMETLVVALSQSTAFAGSIIGEAAVDEWFDPLTTYDRSFRYIYSPVHNGYIVAQEWQRQ